MSGTAASAAIAQTVTGPSGSWDASTPQPKVVLFPPPPGTLHSGRYANPPWHGSAPAFTHTKFAGCGPATSSWKPIDNGIVCCLVKSAPPATATDVLGLDRSIVVYERLPSFVPFEHEFGPSGKYRLSLGSEYSPVTQIPYCLPCSSVATPDQFSQAVPLIPGDQVTSETWTLSR